MQMLSPFTLYFCDTCLNTFNFCDTCLTTFKDTRSGFLAPSVLFIRVLPSRRLRLQQLHRFLVRDVILQEKLHQREHLYKTQTNITTPHPWCHPPGKTLPEGAPLQNTNKHYYFSSLMSSSRKNSTRGSTSTKHKQTLLLLIPDVILQEKLHQREHLYKTQQHITTPHPWCHPPGKTPPEAAPLKKLFLIPNVTLHTVMTLKKVKLQTKVSHSPSLLWA